MYINWNYDNPCCLKKKNLAENLRYCMIVCLMISHKSHQIYVKLIAVSHLNIERKYCHVQSIHLLNTGRGGDALVKMFIGI